MLVTKLISSELCRRIALKDAKAFEYLYETYSAPLYGLILNIIPETSLASQVLQETFVYIFTHINEYNVEKSQLFTWMIVQARNRSFQSKDQADRKKVTVIYTPNISTNFFDKAPILLAQHS